MAENICNNVRGGRTDANQDRLMRFSLDIFQFFGILQTD